MLRAVSAPLHPATNLSRGFAQIVEAMCQAIAARAARDVASAALLVLLWSRLRRLARRLASVAERAAAGTLDTPNRRLSVVATPRRRAPSPWPRGLRALARLAPEVMCFGGQLRRLLAEPEIAALLAATPRLGRHVRPLCRLLGVEPPATPPPAAPPPSVPAPSVSAPRPPRAEARAAPEPPVPRPLALLRVSAAPKPA
jgi:hypothetical protein